MLSVKSVPESSDELAMPLSVSSIPGRFLGEVCLRCPLLKILRPMLTVFLTTLLMPFLIWQIKKSKVNFTTT